MNKQQILAKYGKQFAAKKDSNQAIEGIHYAANGEAFVTNRQIALRIRSVHKFEQPLTLHVSTGHPIDGAYPDVSRIWPDRFDDEIELRRDILDQVALRVRCVADVASRLNKKEPIATIRTDNGVAWLEIGRPGENISMRAFLGNTSRTASSVRTLNAEYLHTALALFVDSDAESITVILGKPLNPIILTDDADIDVLILPYRVPEAST